MMFAFEKFILLKMHKKSGNNANALEGMQFRNKFINKSVLDLWGALEPMHRKLRLVKNAISTHPNIHIYR